MKNILFALSVLAVAAPSAAADFYIGGSHGQLVDVGSFDGQGTNFSATLIGTEPANFSVYFFGYTFEADPRSCGGDEVPVECSTVTSIFGEGDFTLTGGTQDFQVTVPFFCCGWDGMVTFFPTDGSRVHILVNGTAVPEPSSWLMLVGGFGVIGGALRARRRPVVTFR